MKLKTAIGLIATIVAATGQTIVTNVHPGTELVIQESAKVVTNRLGFGIYLWPGLTTRPGGLAYVVTNTSTSTNLIFAPFHSFMGTRTNGVYTMAVTRFDLGWLESPPTDPIIFAWNPSSEPPAPLIRITNRMPVVITITSP